MRLRKKEGESKAAGILKLHKEEPELDTVFIAERFGVTQSHVDAVISGTRKGRLKGVCSKTNRKRANEKRPCPHCGKKLSPAGLGAHLKTRERMGHCPGKKPKAKPKPKPKIPRRRATASQREDVREWT